MLHLGCWMSCFIPYTVSNYCTLLYVSGQLLVYIEAVLMSKIQNFSKIQYQILSNLYKTSAKHILWSRKVATTSLLISRENYHFEGTSGMQFSKACKLKMYWLLSQLVPLDSTESNIIPSQSLFLDDRKALSNFLFLTMPGLFDLGVTATTFWRNF